jgi:hypothetical protein
MQMVMGMSESDISYIVELSMECVEFKLLRTFVDFTSYQRHVTVPLPMFFLSCLRYAAGHKQSSTGSWTFVVAQLFRCTSKDPFNFCLSITSMMVTVVCFPKNTWYCITETPYH